MHIPEGHQTLIFNTVRASNDSYVIIQNILLRSVLFLSITSKSE